MNFCYLLIYTIFLAITNSVPDPEDFNDHFNCIEKFSGTTSQGWECCGFNAIGERHCAPESEWEKYEGKYRRCKKLGNGVSPETLIGTGQDLCCNSNKWVDDCGKCKSFYVWDFKDHAEMSAAATFDETWRTQYLEQNLDSSNGYDNKIFPGGFIKGTLREFNDPNVCIYIPRAAGRIIEIKVESEEAGDRLCIGDLHDESTDRNNPGQNDACSDSNVETCFGDADVSGDKDIGRAFYIFCDEGCEEGGGSGDVPIWLRARFSEKSWMDSDRKDWDVTENVEMWCEYVIRDYPEFDVYPTDIAPEGNILTFEDDSASTLLLSFIFSLLLLVL